jgi:hypothetical protein
VVRPDDFAAQNNPFDAYGQDRLPDARALAQRIEEEGRQAGVARAVPYLFLRGSAVAGSRSSVAWIVGISPVQEKELRVAQPPAEGIFLPEDDPLAVYVAEPAARKLRVGVGDEVSFVVQTPQGAINSLDATVCGIFRKGAPWYDNAFYVTLGAAQALVDWPGGATNVKVLLEDERALPRARAAVEASVDAARPGPLAKGTRVRVESGRFSWIRDHGSLLRPNPIWRLGLEGGSMSRRRATKTPLRSASWTVTRRSRAARCLASSAWVQARSRRRTKARTTKTLISTAR